MASDKPRMHLTTKVYKGVVMFENEIEQIETMDILEDDVWVCSYPRSGTTLTQEMVYLIMTGDFEKAHNTQLDSRFPIIEIKDERFPYYKGIKRVEDMTSPRMVKSHLHHFLLPEQLRNGKGRYGFRDILRPPNNLYRVYDCSIDLNDQLQVCVSQSNSMIIYISRNPKDIVTSFYRLLEWGDELPEGVESFKKFVESFLAGTGICCPWPKHVLQFWESKNDNNLLFLKYEDVIKDLPQTVRKIADFLKKAITEEDVKRICEHCKVDNMRNNPMCNGAYWRNFKHVNDEVEGRFINKGIPGVWREILSPEMSADLDKFMQELDGSGLVFETI